MRKIIYYLPAIAFTLLYGFLAMIGLGGGAWPAIIIGLLLLWASGILLGKHLYWGSLLGALPATCLIYMGTQETGQIINETPIGVLVLVFYIGCGWVVYDRNRKAITQQTTEG